MDFFKKQLYKFLPAIITIAFHALLIILLSIKLGHSLSDDSRERNEQEFALQLPNEQLEDTPPPPPSAQPQTEEVKKITEEPIRELITNEAIEKAEETPPSSQDLGEIPLAEKEDTVIIAEIQKLLEAIQTPQPDDSIKLEEQPLDNKQRAQQALTDNSRRYDDRKFYADNYRTIRNFKKVYPYAAKTKLLIDELNAQLSQITDEKEKRRLIKKTEQELFGKFEKDVRNMSFSQGKLLLKLIARETDQSAYNLIKKYKGKIPATFWYGIGLLFHENLKVKYDSLGEDAILEKIVLKYKQGKL